jgi:hypothetical protein
MDTLRQVAASIVEEICSGDLGNDDVEFVIRDEACDRERGGSWTENDLRAEVRAQLAARRGYNTDPAYGW